MPVIYTNHCHKNKNKKRKKADCQIGEPLGICKLRSTKQVATYRAVQLIQSIHSTRRSLFTSSYNCLLSLQCQAESRSIRKLLSAVCMDWPSLGNHRNNLVPVSSVDTGLSNILNNRTVRLPCFNPIRTKQQY